MKRFFQRVMGIRARRLREARDIRMMRAILRNFEAVTNGNG